MEKIDNFGNMNEYGVPGAKPPKSNEIIIRLVEQSMETCKISKVFMKI